MMRNLMCWLGFHRPIMIDQPRPKDWSNTCTHCFRLYYPSAFPPWSYFKCWLGLHTMDSKFWPDGPYNECLHCDYQVAQPGFSDEQTRAARERCNRRNIACKAVRELKESGAI